MLNYGNNTESLALLQDAIDPISPFENNDFYATFNPLEDLNTHDKVDAILIAVSIATSSTPQSIILKVAIANIIEMIERTLDSLKNENKISQGQSSATIISVISAIEIIIKFLGKNRTKNAYSISETLIEKTSLMNKLIEEGKKNKRKDSNLYPETKKIHSEPMHGLTEGKINTVKDFFEGTKKSKINDKEFDHKFNINDQLF